MLKDTPLEVVSYTGVERSGFIRHDIDIIGFHDGFPYYDVILSDRRERRIYIFMDLLCNQRCFAALSMTQ